jgi:hypothetical protein
VHQPGQGFVHAAPETERLEARIRVQRHCPERVVVQPLGDLAGRHVDDQSGTALSVSDDPVRRAAFDQVLRDIAAGIDEAADTVFAPSSSAIGRSPSWYRKACVGAPLTCLPTRRPPPSRT